MKSLNAEDVSLKNALLEIEKVAGALRCTIGKHCGHLVLIRKRGKQSNTLPHTRRTAFLVSRLGREMKKKPVSINNVASVAFELGCAFSTLTDKMKRVNGGMKTGVARKDSHKKRRDRVIAKRREMEEQITNRRVTDAEVFRKFKNPDAEKASLQRYKPQQTHLKENK